VLVGILGGDIVETPLAEVAHRTKDIDRALLTVATSLAR